MMRTSILMAALCGAASLASAEIFVIQNATIWTMAKGKITGSVVVKAMLSPLVPGLQDLANAIVSGSWPAIIQALLSLGAIIWYAFVKK